MSNSSLSRSVSVIQDPRYLKLLAIVMYPSTTSSFGSILIVSYALVLSLGGMYMASVFDFPPSLPVCSCSPSSRNCLYRTLSPLCRSSFDVNICRQHIGGKNIEDRSDVMNWHMSDWLMYARPLTGACLTSLVDHEHPLTVLIRSDSRSDSLTSLN